MIDAVSAGLHAVATRSPLAYPLVFAAGAVTSIGPCAAPRYVALAALVNASRRPARIIAAFVAGLVGAYVVLGVAAGAVGALWSASRLVYAGLAMVLAVAGVVTLLRGGTSHVHESTRVHHAGARASLGGTFLLGASSAFVVSPCCTPVVAGIAGLTTASGHTGEGVALLAAFAFGHALPIVSAGALGTRVARGLRHVAESHAPAVAAGTLMLALAAYYGVLA
ncbi:MAG: sulfite exporter TauE/SafE family protein [Candidatus Eremiobacteraeota bacterium]|nr:sulfite exporter TauE/SafE family protein [Candidatus Eremiobacteraeota bacterium]